VVSGVGKARELAAAAVGIRMTLHVATKIVYSKAELPTSDFAPRQLSVLRPPLTIATRDLLEPKSIQRRRSSQ
jgi:hypothetical protein